MAQRNSEDFANLLKSLFSTVRKLTGENLAQLAASVTGKGPERTAFHNWLRRASSAGVKFVHGGNRQKLDALLARLFSIPGKTTWTDEELFETPAPNFVRQYEEARTAYEQRRGNLEWIKTHEPRTYWTVAFAMGEERANSFIHECFTELPNRAEAVHHLKWEAANITHTFTFTPAWPDNPEEFWQQFSQKYPNEAALYELWHGRQKVIEKLSGAIQKARQALHALNDRWAEGLRQKILQRATPSPIGESENEETPDDS